MRYTCNANHHRYSLIPRDYVSVFYLLITSHPHRPTLIHVEHEMCFVRVLD